MEEEEKMTKEDWENVDKDSRDVFIKFLEAIKAEDIQPSQGNCCIDVVFTLKGIRIAAELKRRTFAHDKFGDILVEKLKRDAAKRRIEKGEFQKVWAVNDFTDSVIAIANIEDPQAKMRLQRCPQTSRVKGASRQLVIKECLNLPQKAKYKYYAGPDGKLHFKKI